MSDVITAETDHNGGTRVQPDVISQYYTEIDGVEVIARELAVSPHPRWKMQHPQTHHFVTKLLLADERELYECNHCHLYDEALKSITAHLGAHSPQPKPPITDVETIKTVLREVERARRLYGATRYAAPAVEALTRLGVRSASSRDWTPAMVTSLYGAYKDRYPVRAPKVQTAAKKATAAVPPKPRRAPAESPAVVVPATDSPITAALELLVAVDDQLAQARELLRQAAMPVDPEMAEKAAKYDQMRGLLG